MTSIKKQVQIGSLVLLLLFMSSSAFGRKRLSPELDAKSARLGALSGAQSPTELIDVIVQVRAGAPLSQHRQKMLSLGATQKNALDR